MEIDIDKEKIKENAEKLKQQGAEIGKTVAWMAKTFFGGKKAILDLCDGLITQNSVGRIYAAEMILKNISEKDIAAMPYLIEALSDGEKKVVIKAAASLAKLGEKARFAIFGLKNCADSSSDAEIRKATEDAMSVIGNDVSVAFAESVDYLTNPNAFIRRYAADLIGSLGLAARNAVPFLKDAVQDSSANVRCGAIKALSVMGRHASQAVSVIVERLTIDDDMEVRREALLALIAIGPSVAGVKECVIETALGTDKSLSELALSNLGKFGEAALPVLVKILKEGNVSQKRKAAQSLGDLGGAGKDALSALSSCLTSEDKLLQTLAKNSIQKIRRGGM